MTTYFWAVIALGLASYAFAAVFVSGLDGNSNLDLRNDISALETRVAELEETP